MGTVLSKSRPEFGGAYSDSDGGSAKEEAGSVSNRPLCHSPVHCRNDRSHEFRARFRKRDTCVTGELRTRENKNTAQFRISSAGRGNCQKNGGVKPRMAEV